MPNLTSQSRWPGPHGGRQRLLAHEVTEDRQASSRVSALMWIRSKKSPSAGKALTLLWAAEPEMDERRRHLRRAILEADDRRHLAEAGEVLRLEVEHRDAVPVDAGVDIHDELASARLGRHRGDPLGGGSLVDLDAETGGRFNDPRDRRGAIRSSVRLGRHGTGSGSPQSVNQLTPPSIGATWSGRCVAWPRAVTVASTVHASSIVVVRSSVA